MADWPTILVVIVQVVTKTKVFSSILYCITANIVFEYYCTVLWQNSGRAAKVTCLMSVWEFASFSLLPRPKVLNLIFVYIQIQMYLNILFLIFCVCHICIFVFVSVSKSDLPNVCLGVCILSLLPRLQTSYLYKYKYNL